MLTATLDILVSNFFKSELVAVPSSFLELVNLELRLAVFNFCRYSVSFIFDFVKILRPAMSILAGMFESLLNSYCSVCLSERLFLAHAAS